MTNGEDKFPVLDGVGEVTVDPAVVGVIVVCVLDGEETPLEV